MHIFFVFIFGKYEFSAFLVCIYFHKCHLNENFVCTWFCEIDQNSQNSWKKIQTKISTLKIQSNDIIKNKNILKIILALLYREWQKQWKCLIFLEMKVFVFSVDSF